ncbi:MAG: hypothetical protein AB1445_12145 [Bacillota bacterium]
MVEHGFTGGSSTIRRLVRTLHDPTSEAYLPLEFSPGEAAQVDSGAAKVWLDVKLVEVQFAVKVQLTHSKAVGMPYRQPRNQGMSVRNMAQVLGISRNTVRTYLRGNGPPSLQRTTKNSSTNCG